MDPVLSSAIRVSVFESRMISAGNAEHVAPAMIALVLIRPSLRSCRARDLLMIYASPSEVDPTVLAGLISIVQSAHCSSARSRAVSPARKTFWFPAATPLSQVYTFTQT